MQMEIIVLKYKHYSMEDNQGLSVVMVGNTVNDNNESGLQISEAPVLNYAELNHLKSIPADKYPAKFKAIGEITKIKNKGGKDLTGLSFRNLQYVCSMHLVDVK